MVPIASDRGSKGLTRRSCYLFLLTEEIRTPRQEIVVTARGASSLVYEFTTESASPAHDLASPAHDLATGWSGGFGFPPSAPR